MCISSSFIFITEEYSVVCVYCILFIHLPIDRHLDFFHFLDVMNNSAMNIHVSLCGGMFLFLLGRVDS